MLNKVANKLSTTLLMHKVIVEDNYDVYVYGFELLLSFLFSTSIILIAGIIFGYLLETIAFLIVFVSLRSFTGGYHAKTYAVCSIVTFITFCAVLFLSNLIHITVSLYLILAIVGGIIMMGLVPIQHPNKKITFKQKRKYKVISISLFFVFISVGVWLNSIEMSLSSTIFFTLIADLLLLFNKIKKKGES